MDIRIGVDFPDHPKVRALSRRIGEDCIKYLIRFWLWTARYKPKGNLKGIDAAEIEFAAGWGGKGGELHAALLKEGWIHESDKGLVVHQWGEHQPWACRAEERRERAKKAARARWNVNAHSIAGGITNGIAGSNAEGNTPSPLPFPSPLIITSLVESIVSKDRRYFLSEEGKLVLEIFRWLALPQFGLRTSPQEAVDQLRNVVGAYGVKRVRAWFGRASCGSRCHPKKFWDAVRKEKAKRKAKAISDKVRAVAL